MMAMLVLVWLNSQERTMEDWEELVAACRGGKLEILNAIVAPNGVDSIMEIEPEYLRADCLTRMFARIVYNIP